MNNKYKAPLSFEDKHYESQGGRMFKKSVSCVLLVSLVMMFFISCSEERSVIPEKATEGEQVGLEMSAGELHNEFARAFLKVRPERCITRLDEDQNYLDTYVESSREICKTMGIDVELNRDVLDEFLQLNNTMKEAGIWDAFNPLAYSPPEVINHLKEIGAISAKDAQHIQSMLKKARDISPCDLKKDDSNDGMLLLTAAEISEASPFVLEVKDVLENSITLWEEVFDASGEELVGFDPNDPIVSAWWKTVTKLVASAVGDTIVFSVTTGLTWTPPVILFFTSLASLAVYEAFAERGW